MPSVPSRNHQPLYMALLPLCATKRNDVMRGNLHGLYRQAMSRWAIAPGGMQTKSERVVSGLTPRWFSRASHVDVCRGAEAPPERSVRAVAGHGRTLRSDRKGGPRLSQSCTYTWRQTNGAGPRPSATIPYRRTLSWVVLQPIRDTLSQRDLVIMWRQRGAPVPMQRCGRGRALRNGVLT